MASELSLFTSTLFTFRTEPALNPSKRPVLTPSPVFLPPQSIHTLAPPKTKRSPGFLAAGNVAAAQAEVDVPVADGYTMTQVSDKMIDVCLNEKRKSKEWKRLLIFRDEWGKYRESFYSRCEERANGESDSQMKQKLIDLSRKVRKIDDEMEKHAELLKEIEENPMDINAIVARRRRDFTEDFFRHLTLLSEIHHSLEDRDSNILCYFSE